MNYFSLPPWVHAFLRKVEDTKGIVRILAGNELFYALMRNKDYHYIKDEGRPRVLNHPLIRDHTLEPYEVLFLVDFDTVINGGHITCD